MYAAPRWRCDVIQILVATLRGAVHQQQRAAAYAALLPSLISTAKLLEFFTLRGAALLANRVRGRIRCAATISTAQHLEI